MSTAEKSALLRDGMSLSREEFLRRWEASPGVKNAELINGVVRMPSPLSTDHANIDGPLGWWLQSYKFATPGVEHLPNATWLMGGHAPQPDQSLRVRPEYGGRSGLEGRLASGVPELALEVSLSSADADLGEKLRMYQSSGVEEYLVALVEPREVRWHRLDGGTYRRLEPGEDGVFRSEVFPGLWLDPAALFGEDEERFQAVSRAGLESPEHGEFVEQLRQRRGEG